MSETFVRLKPRDEWRAGLRQGPARSRRCARRSTEIPGVRFNFSQPIKDNVEEAVSGRARPGRAQDLRHRSRRRCATTLEQARRRSPSVPGIVDLDLYRDATRAAAADRARPRGARARRASPSSDAQDVVETALAGKVATDLWEGERPVPVRLMLPVARARRRQRASATLARADAPAAAACRCASSRSIDDRDRRGRHQPRSATAAVLALKFNVEGRDMGSVVKDAHRGRRRET